MSVGVDRLDAEMRRGDREMSSDPWATSLPKFITATCVQTCSTSVSRWLERNTVDPSAASSRTRWRISRVPLGVHAVRRFVENQQLARSEERVREAEPLAHAEAVGTELRTAVAVRPTRRARCRRGGRRVRCSPSGPAASIRSRF